jgi:DNA-binding transcriptional ArsR family regulator
MPRASTTADVFNAIAEPRRRQIIEALARSENAGLAVQTLVAMLRLPQPAVSKHLAVLLAVRLVLVNRRGRQRFYRLNAAELRPVHEWSGMFERFWKDQLTRIKHRAERAWRKEQSS